MSIFGLQDNETVLSEEYITNTFVSQFYQPKITQNNLLSYNLISEKPDLNQYVTDTVATQTYQPKITQSNLLSYNLISEKPDLNQYVQVVNFNNSLNNLIANSNIQQILLPYSFLVRFPVKWLPNQMQYLMVIVHSTPI